MLLIFANNLGPKVGRVVVTLLRLIGSRNSITLCGHANSLGLAGMSTEQNGKFHLGETWGIGGTARNTDGSLLDLTGASVSLRICSDSAIVLDLSTPEDGAINSPATSGSYSFEIAPTQQSGMTLSSYDYEVRVTLADGTVTVQNTGEIKVLPSKFVDFP